MSGQRLKLEKALSTSEFAALEAASSTEQCTVEIEHATAKIVMLEKKMKAEEKELTTIRDSLKGKTQQFSDQTAIKQKSLEPWNEKINQKQSAIAVAESELAILHEKANAGAVALEEITAKITSIEQGRNAKLEELEDCKAKKAKLEEEVGKAQAELSKLARKDADFRARLSGARQKADEARASPSRCVLAAAICRPLVFTLPGRYMGGGQRPAPGDRKHFVKTLRLSAALAALTLTASTTCAGVIDLSNALGPSGGYTTLAYYQSMLGGQPMTAAQQAYADQQDQLRQLGYQSELGGDFALGQILYHIAYGITPPPVRTGLGQRGR